MSKKKMIVLITSVSLILIYVLFLPYPTAESAVRRHIFFSLHPIKAFSAQVKGTGSTSFGGANLYCAGDVSRSFIWVKKNKLGYRVIADGTGP